MSRINMRVCIAEFSGGQRWVQNTSVEGRVITAPPGGAHIWLTHLDPDLPVPAVVLRIIGVVAEDVLAAQVQTQFFDSFRQVLQISHAEELAACLIGDFLEEPRTLQEALQQPDGVNADVRFSYHSPGLGGGVAAAVVASV